MLSYSIGKQRAMYKYIYLCSVNTYAVITWFIWRWHGTCSDFTTGLSVICCYGFLWKPWRAISTSDLWLLSYDLYIRCFIHSRLRQMGRKGFTDNKSRVIFSDHMQPHGRQNKFNPINSMRTGEEMEMIECKQFQTKQSVKFKGPQL